MKFDTIFELYMEASNSSTDQNPIMDIYKKMIEVDKKLTAEGANWNHNLANIFKIYVKVKERPEKLKRFISVWDEKDWLKRGDDSGAMKEISDLDEQLLKDIKSIMKQMTKTKEISNEIR